MSVRVLRIFLICLVFLLCKSSYSQNWIKLGPYATDKFKHDAENSKRIIFHRYVPGKNGVITYNDRGKAFKLSLNDTINVGDLYKGSWAGKSGKWIEYYNSQQKGSTSYTFYVLLNEMIDI